jgi:hypothetical protein
MLEMALFLTVEPSLSLRGLGWCLQASRIVALLVFACVLIDNGASLLFTGAVLTLGLGILAYLGASAYYSVYPFLPVLVLAVAFLSSYYTDAPSARWARRFGGHGWRVDGLRTT